MKINNDVVEAIGNTPLIKLKRASEATGCAILGKAELAVAAEGFQALGGISSAKVSEMAE